MKAIRRLILSIALPLLAVCAFWIPAGAQTYPGKIAFTSTRDNGFGQIYVMNPDRSNQTNISNNFLTQHNDDYPSFNRIGTKIAFVSDRTGTWNVYTMNADGSNQTRVTNLSVPFAEEPAWSPDGTKIAFMGHGGPSSTWEVYVVNADGSGLAQLTSNPPTAMSPGGDYSPVFTPDGSRILFSRYNPSNSNGADQYDLWTMNPDGTGQALFGPRLGAATSPSFSPDGSKIAFIGTFLVTNLPASPFPGLDISVMNANLTGQTVLTTGGTSNLDPSFSPDGTRIVFDSDRSHPSYPGGPPSIPDIYVMNADGTGMVQLTFAAPIGQSSSLPWNARPSWGPGAIGLPAVVSLALSPASVTGGGSSQATITLSAPAPVGGAAVAMSSSSASASVPVAVTIPAGSTSAVFTAMTGSVSAATSASVTASYGGVTQMATLQINPPPPADVVTITRDEYTVSQKQLRVEATSTSLTATLNVYVTSTGALIGTMTNVGGGKYQIQTTGLANPVNITVKSSLGGSASGPVTVHN